MSAHCVTLRIEFVSNHIIEYPIHVGGDWRYTSAPDLPERIVVRPHGKDSNARHEVPLRNVLSVMIVGLNHDPVSVESESPDES